MVGMKQEIELLKQFYVAISSGDITAAISMMDPQAERKEFEGSPNAASFRGHAALTAHFTEARGTWAEGSCDPQEFIVMGDKVIALVHVHVRLKDKTEWLDGHVADTFAFKDGKISQFHSFFDKEQALKWASLTSC